MASLTVRKLDEALKASLRLRAARAGRSVEDEVRMILREATEAPAGPASPARHAAPQPHRSRAPEVKDRPRVTLIIGGGIAAYKALDLIRRLKERGIHVRCVMTRAAQQFVTP
ncbi:MAG: FitA-like ribbon-helix-helix domain-containing protein, partial [Afipia sp.]